MAKVAYGSSVSNIRGKVGSDVYTEAHDGATMRIRSQPRVRNTVAQSSIRLNLARAAAAYRNLTPAQAARWQDYSRTLTRTNPVNGKRFNPTANTVFVGLASKFLQVSPGGVIPLTPPAATFLGDSVLVSAAGGAGQVTFTGSGANAANIRTELLLQRLLSPNREPLARGYRSRGFAAFAAGALTQNVAVTPGFYAAAYRFVNVQTGQQSGLVTLPVLQVN